MTASELSEEIQADYSGPMPKDLGSLADWMSGMDLSETAADRTFDTPLPEREDPVSLAGVDAEDYSGPTPEELGILAQWLEWAETSPSVSGPTPPAPPAIPQPSTTGSVRESDSAQPWESRDPEHCRRADATATEPPFFEGVMRELLEIETSLQKKAVVRS